MSTCYLLLFYVILQFTEHLISVLPMKEIHEQDSSINIGNNFNMEEMLTNENYSRRTFLEYCLF